jgi:hypothetical protein
MLADRDGGWVDEKSDKNSYPPPPSLCGPGFDTPLELEAACSVFRSYQYPTNNRHKGQIYRQQWTTIGAFHGGGGGGELIHRGILDLGGRRGEDTQLIINF